jgi:hypothetical protein
VRWPPALSPKAHDFIRDVLADFAKVVATVQRC